MSVAVEQKPLTRADRCDRCNAAAALRVILPLFNKPNELLFCQHHASEHGPKLMIIDGVLFYNRKAEES